MMDRTNAKFFGIVLLSGPSPALYQKEHSSIEKAISYTFTQLIGTLDLRRMQGVGMLEVVTEQEFMRQRIEYWRV